MASTTMLAPYGPARALARRIVAQPTGNVYQLNALGAAAIDTADVAWFQTQGFSAVPSTVAGQVAVYAPYVPDQEMARRVRHEPSGNHYVFNAAGFAMVATADAAWFLDEGYALAPAPGSGQTAMYAMIEVGQGLAGPITSPITGTTYFITGAGYVLVATADVPWFASQGFAPAVAGAPAVVFPPTVSGTQATIAADFAGNQYWASAGTQASFAAWLTAIGGTYGRSSSATYLQGGVVKTAAANAPRFPTALDGTPLGLRLTGAATNLLLWSQDFSNAAWSKKRISLGATVAAPDGTTTAGLLVEDTSAISHNLYQLLVNAAGTYTFSIFAKAATRTRIVVAVNGSNNPTLGIDLSNGSTFLPTDITVNLPQSYSVTALGNGWYLCSMSDPSITENVTPTVYLANGTLTSYQGDGASGVYLWGAQFTNTNFPVDYIPTTTVTVTQAADDLHFPWSSTTATILAKTNSLLADGILFDFQGTGGSTLYVSGGGLYANNGAALGPIAISYSGVNKIVLAGAPSSRNMVINGGAVQSDANPLMGATTTAAYVSQANNNLLSPYGNFSLISLWTIQANSAQAQALSVLP